MPEGHLQQLFGKQGGPEALPQLLSCLPCGSLHCTLLKIQDHKGDVLHNWVWAIHDEGSLLVILQIPDFRCVNHRAASHLGMTLFQPKLCFFWNSSPIWGEDHNPTNESPQSPVLLLAVFLFTFSHCHIEEILLPYFVGLGFKCFK